MKFPHKSGKALCLYNGKVQWLDYTPGYYTGSFAIGDQGNILTDMLDYYESLDCYYHQSDDASRMYHIVHVLHNDPTKPIPATLTQAEVDAYKMTAIQPVINAVMQQQIHPDDLTFAMHIFSSPCFLHKAWEANNHNLEKTCNSILQSIFHL